MRTLANGLLVLVAAAGLAANAPETFAAAPESFAADAGGTYLSWWACPGDPHAATGVPFDCVAEGGTVYTLVGTFVLANDVPHAMSMSADVNIAFSGPQSVPAFWSIVSGGCNPFAITRVKGMPSYCGGHVNAFCSGDTNQCDLLYVPSVLSASGVLRLSITLLAPSATSLAAGQSYFAFALNIPMDGAATCTGCTAPAAIGFNSGTIYSADGPPIIVSGSYPGAKACATVNGGSSECARVPVQRLSWGRLKSLYR